MGCGAKMMDALEVSDLGSAQDGVDFANDK